MSCSGCHKGVKRLLVGAIGIGKALAGIDRPEVAEIQRRVKICDACTVGGILKGETPWLCPECKCVIAAAIRVAGKKCPLGKW